MRGCAALGALLLGACQAPAVVPINAEGTGVVFLVMVDADGAPTRISSGLVLDDGVPVAGERPRLRVDPPEVGAVAVSLSPQVLAEIDPLFDPQRLSEVVLSIGTPPREVERLPQGAEILLKSRLPKSASLTAYADVSLDSLSESLTLSVVVDPERCRNPNFEPLVPFGRVANVLADTDVVLRTGGIKQIVASPFDDQVLLGTFIGIFLARPGEGVLPVRQPSQNEPGNGVRVDHPLLASGEIVGFVVHPVPLPNGDRRILLVESQETPGPLGRLYWLDWGPEGLKQLRTATVSAGHRFRSVAQAANGDILLGADGGKLLLYDGDQWLRRSLTSSTQLMGGPVLATRDPQRPWVVATGNFLHMYRADLDIFESFEAEARIQRLGLRPTGSLEVWAGGDLGGLYVFQERWSRVSLALPPRYGPCAAETTLPHSLNRKMDGVFFLDDYLYLLPVECAVVMAVRLQDRCVSLQVPQGMPVQTGVADYEALSIAQDQLLVGGHSGLLYRAKIR